MDSQFKKVIDLENGYDILEEKKKSYEDVAYPIQDLDYPVTEAVSWSTLNHSNMFIPSQLAGNLNDAKKLELWFSYLRSTTVDIISQLGGSSACFYVHVESLILKFSLDPLLRFDYDTAPQPVNLIYFVESFLSTLKQCGGTYRLIFINTFRHLLNEVSPFLLAVRDAFYFTCLLSDNLNHDDFFCFSCFEDPLFLSFITKSQPPFFLLDDCTSLWDSLTGKTLSDELRSLPYLFIYRLLEAEIHVALLFDIRSKGRKVLAYCVSPPIAPLGCFSVSSLLKHHILCDASSYNIKHLYDVLLLCKSQKLDFIGFREILLVTFMRNHLEKIEQNSSEGQFFLLVGQVLLLCSMLCRILPLRHRFLSGFDLNRDDLPSFTSFQCELKKILHEFFHGVSFTLNQLYPVLTEIKVNDSTKPKKNTMEYNCIDIMRDYLKTSECMRDILDFFDGRLFYIVCILIIKQCDIQETSYVDNNFFNLPGPLVENFLTVMKSVCPNNPLESLCFNLLPFSPFIKECCQINPIVIEEDEPIPLPLESKFLKLLMDTKDGKTDLLTSSSNVAFHEEKESNVGMAFWNSSLGKTFTPGLLMDVAQLQIEHRLTVDNLTSFVNKKFLEGLDGAQKNKMLQKQRLKIAQRGASTVHKFGASLGTPSRYHHSIKVSVPGQHVWSKILNSCAADEDDKRMPGKKKEKPVDSKKKVSSKAKEIIKKNEEILHQKIIRTDNERLPGLLSKINVLGYKRLSPNDLCDRILDILVGTSRHTQELNQFPALHGFLSLAESRAQILMAIIDVLVKSLSHYDSLEQYNAADACDGEKETELHNMMCFSFLLAHQIFIAFSRVLIPEDIIKLQKLLIMLGFKKSSVSLFKSWKNIAQRFSDSSQNNLENDVRVGKMKSSSSKGSGKKNAKTALNLDSAFVDPKTVMCLRHAIPSELDIEIQMHFLGHEMARSLGSAHDPRVKFLPDKWQTRLLDVIDEYRSTLVCAPTGCGKTFACYYAMEKVLTYDNDGVCVFVCPSKALVQQVEHEVKARFSTKEYPSGCRMGLIGTLLTHIEDKPLKCQILLTLPSMFEILLMSPNYREWVDRLRYVILDEIHCIGEGDEEGRAWERLIQLIPCPFIALSATVGNPLSFHHWLSHAHQSHDTAHLLDKSKCNVEIITFDERYADLDYFVVQPDCSNEALGSDANDNDKPSLIALNPFVCLPYEQILSQGIVKNFYIPSADFLKAYFVVRDLLCCFYGVEEEKKSCGNQRFVNLHRVDQAEVLSFIQEMSPNRYFSDVACISKRQYRYYMGWFIESFSYMVRQQIINQTLYSTILYNLVDMKPINEKKDIVQGTLWSPCRKTVTDKVLDDVASWSMGKEQEQEPSDLMNSVYSFSQRVCGGRKSFDDPQTLLKFCRTLQKLGFLPMLLFNFNRTVVTHLFENITSLLVKLQHEKYYGTPEAVSNTRTLNKKRMDEYKALVRHREMLEKLKGVSKRQREEEDMDIDDADALPLPPPPIDIAEEYDEEFSFANRRVWGTHHDEIEEIIEGVSNRLRKKGSFFVEALRRGIGFHHSGLGRRYRVAVEMLFRMGFLSIVFSTETLSLGVNMPCKATVFLGDSLMLTSLLFRQTAGRAGRRGFDVLGHVVFWDIPFSKIKRLICAHLPVLSGELNVTVTDVLRTYQLINTVEAQHNQTLKTKQATSSAVQLKKLESQFLTQQQALQKSLLRVYHMPLYMVRTTSAEETLQDLPAIRNAIQYAFRFSANRARMSNLLNHRAHPISLAGLCILLYNEEPGSLALVSSLLSSRFLDYLTAPATPEEILPTDKSFGDIQFPPWMLRRFITLFSQFVVPVHLNYNVYLRMRLTDQFDPLLPCVNPFVIDAIDEYNSIAFTNAKNYVRSLATSTLDWETEYTLPITKVFFHGSQCPIQDYKKMFNQFIGGHLKFQVIENFTRSPFSAISGHSNSDFCSTYELHQSKPQNIFLSDSVVSCYAPSTVTYKGQRRYLLSNYALHFFTYRSQRRTAECSFINANDLWDYLTRFESCLWAFKSYISESVRLKAYHDSTTSVENNEGSQLLKIVDTAFTVFEKLKKAEAAI